MDDIFVTIEHFHYSQDIVSLTKQVEELLVLAKKTYKQGVSLMATAAEMQRELMDANLATNEIASDLDELMNKVGEGSISPQDAEDLKANITRMKTALQGIASKYSAVDNTGGTPNPVNPTGADTPVTNRENPH